MAQIKVSGLIKCENRRQYNQVLNNLASYLSQTAAEPGNISVSITPDPSHELWFRVDERYQDLPSLKEHQYLMYNSKWGRLTANIAELEVTGVDAPNPYLMDFDWAWDGKDVKTLAVKVENADLEPFLASLYQDENGVRGSGGWAIYPQEEAGLYHLVSGGEDLADALEDAAERIYEAVWLQPGAKLSWYQL